MLKTLSRAVVVLIALTAGANAQSEEDVSCIWSCADPLAEAQAQQDAENALWVTEEEAQAIAAEAEAEAQQVAATPDEILDIDPGDRRSHCPVDAVC